VVDVKGMADLVMLVGQLMWNSDMSIVCDAQVGLGA
jgi:hypothetical protein